MIALDGRIVGRYIGAIGGTGIHRDVTADGTQVPALPLLLSGCPTGTTNYADPDASRKPLPAGRYQLLAVFTGPGLQVVGRTTVTITS